MISKHFSYYVCCLFILLVALWPVLLRSYLRNDCQVQGNKDFPLIFFKEFYSFVVVKKILCMISIFVNLLWLGLWSNIWSILKNVPCTLKKNVHSVVLCCYTYVCLLDLIDLKSCSVPLFSCWSSVGVLYFLLKMCYWCPQLLFHSIFNYIKFHVHILGPSH